MKNLLIGLFILGLTNLSYSQSQLLSEVEETETTYRATTPHIRTKSFLNIPYLNTVQNAKKAKQY